MDNQIIDHHVKKNIPNYLTNSFIQMLEVFQEIVYKSNDQIQQITKNFNGTVYLNNNNQFNIKPSSQLSPGLNKNIGVQLYALRVLYTKFYTFILASQKVQVIDISQLYCLIIQTSDFQAPFNQIWKKGLGPFAKLLIKQPHLYNDSFVDIKIIRVVIQNAQIKQQSKYKADVNLIKEKGNQYFKKLDYIEALNYYEYGLSCCHQFSDANTRVILYTNSAASLYKLNLFDFSLKYSAISLRIDRNYYKNYAWKINCLLQKKLFNEIPNLLVILQPKASSQDFSKMNTKYSIYLSNSLGMYNWYQIAQVKNPKSEVYVCDYLSKFISIRAYQNKSVYYALENIKKHSILVISKPLAFDKKGTENVNSICDKIIRCFIIQKSFSTNVKELFYKYQHDGQKLRHKILQSKQIQKKIRMHLVKPKDITTNDAQTSGFGLWHDLTKFTHSCNPNCSVVHFETIMVISTCTNIKQGQMFTIDFASDVQPSKRKQFLLKKYNILCKCSVCELKSWPDFSSKQNIVKINDCFSSITIIKHVFWHLIINGFTNEQKVFLDKLNKIVINQVSWNDILIAIRLLRLANNQKINKILNKILVIGLSAHLKIPDQLAEKIITVLK